MDGTQNSTNIVLGHRLDNDPSSPTTAMSFFKSIENLYGFTIKKLLKNWLNFNERLAKAIPQRRFLLRCKKDNIFPRHIEQTSKRLNNIVFFSRTYTRKRECYIYHQKIKLLDWEISDVHLHIKFLRTQLDRIHNKLEKTSLPRTVLSRFLELDELKFKRIFRSLNAKLIDKFNRLANEVDISLVPEINIDNYFQNLTNTAIPQEVKEVVALGRKFCSVPKPTKQNIIDTVKNVEFALKKSEYIADNEA